MASHLAEMLEAIRADGAMIQPAAFYQAAITIMALAANSDVPDYVQKEQGEILAKEILPEHLQEVVLKRDGITPIKLSKGWHKRRVLDYFQAGVYVCPFISCS